MLEKIVQTVYDIIWSPALIALLVIAGLYFTIRTRCVQVRRIGEMARLLFGSRKQKDRKEGSPKGMSSFQAFCVSLSGRVGTGNVVGVATAIALGGPGSVFWMWVIAFFGASTAFMEATLAQMYKFHHNRGYRGTPACYIEKGLGQRWLGIVFAAFTILGNGLLLAMVQSNGVSSAFANSMSVPPIVTGLVITALLMLVILGGVKRIAQVASFLTPFMAITYLLFAFVIIVANWRSVPGVFSMIFSSAFGFGPAFGGIIGSAISMGVKRGLFSNEAGQGGGAIVAASAAVQHPVQQGLVQAFSVYIDTLLVCTATALMILCTGTYNVFGPDGSMIAANSPELGANYVGYTQAAIDTVLPNVGSTFVAIALAFFVFTTFMAYYLYSESSIIYLCTFGKEHPNKKLERFLIWVYRALLFTTITIGACKDTDLMWTIGDIGLGLTTWINVIVLFLLCPQAIRALKEYEGIIKQR